MPASRPQRNDRLPRKCEHGLEIDDCEPCETEFMATYWVQEAAALDTAKANARDRFLAHAKKAGFKSANDGRTPRS